ncbi:hypothetical protein FRC11_004494, partial [Ceratobasidium sp. 423]
MAAANHPTAQQPIVEEVIAAPVPPIIPDNAPVGPVEAQLPVNAPHGVQANPLQNTATNNHPFAVQAAGPVGAAAPGVVLAPGTSPLLRSL